MTGERRGTLLAISAYLCWGLFPLYWPLLLPAGPVEILSHRIVWTAVVVLVIGLFRRRWAWLGALRHDGRRLRLLGTAAVAIAINWGVYIWGVNTGHVVETSLGYFINPLVTVLLGVVLLAERLRPVQWVAIGLASAAVAVLTVAYGRPPWIGLILAITFATYGLTKKKIGMPAVESLTAESGLLFLPALGWLIALQVSGSATFGHAPARTTLLLVGCGVVTTIPLLLFGAAAPLVPLSSMGLLQYITPSIQFLIGVRVLHERVTSAELTGYLILWAALVIFSVDSLRAARQRAVGRSAEPSVAELA